MVKRQCGTGLFYRFHAQTHYPERKIRSRIGERNAVSRRPARVTQADIARALRAAEQVGAHVAVEISPDGTIRLVPSGAAPIPVARSGTAKDAADVVEERLR